MPPENGPEGPADRRYNVVFTSISTTVCAIIMMLIRFLMAAIDVYQFVIFARVVFSWLPPRTRMNPIYGFIYQITEPVLRPLRELLPSFQGIDLSPIAAIVLLYVLRSLVAGAAY